MNDQDSQEVCVFCRIIAGAAPAHIVLRHEDAIVLHPLAPVTPGHLLVVSRAHVPDAGASPEAAAATMRIAAEVASGLGACNIITSRGSAATQTVPHLHLHVVPRRPGDGLMLPWTPA